MSLLPELIKPAQHFCIVLKPQTVLLLDPKAAALVATYTSDSHLGKAAIFLSTYQQILVPQLDKPFITVWNTDCQKPVMKIPTLQRLTILKTNRQEDILFGVSTADRIFIWQLATGALLAEMQSPASRVIWLQYKDDSQLLYVVGEATVARLTLSDLLFERKPGHSFTLGRHIACAAFSNQTLALAYDNQVVLLKLPYLTETGRLSLEQKVTAICHLNGRFYFTAGKQVSYIDQGLKTKNVASLKDEPNFILGFAEEGQVIVGGKLFVLRCGGKGQVRMENGGQAGLLVKRFDHLVRQANCIPILDKHKRQRQHVSISAKRVEYKPDYEQVLRFIGSAVSSSLDKEAECRRLTEQNNKLKQLCEKAFQQLQRKRVMLEGYKFS